MGKGTFQKDVQRQEGERLGLNHRVLAYTRRQVAMHTAQNINIAPQLMYNQTQKIKFLSALYPPPSPLLLSISLSLVFVFIRAENKD
jgi:hypothetical protein